MIDYQMHASPICVCNRPTEECAGKCLACKGCITWREAKRYYECDCGQGYLLSAARMKAMDESEMLKFMKEHEAPIGAFLTHKPKS